jgi:hypothetical protein
MEPEYTNIGRTENEDPSLPLFHGVKYALDTKLNNTLTQEVSFLVLFITVRILILILIKK